ncbi:MAG: DUF2505 domain-containing protein [Gammaproteobacteria bacterium]|uniref:Uncharacterized protein n=1 Tax=Marinobacter nitratireducens TaxID=1137280 RepID=A0A072N2Y5_9GAMM|nr:DUF2505 domain-containing protein [Marinobacter nitratireducens]KEF31861.1 hypothetical protein D777_01547 [Marinobacter nitratireducens]TNE80108.1 MAG: DUF2505 domain-containing protein [Gammaproteobacteria bacterium]
MQLEQKHAYQADLDRVLGAFFDEQHILKKNEQLGARNVRVTEISRDDSSGKLVIEREMTTSIEVPGMLASFHREWNEVRQEEHWFRKSDDEWHCEFRVHIHSVPAKIKGMMKLQGQGDSCVNHVTLDVRCDVPLLGKKIARFLADDSNLKIEREYQTTCQLL